MTYSQCFACGNPVLGLRGQDTILNPVYLSSQNVEDRQALEAKVYDECHLSCLMRSSWGSFWTRRTFTNMHDIRGFPVIARHDDKIYLRGEVIHDTIILGENGWYVEVADADLRKIQPTTGGWLVPIQYEITLLLSDYPSLAQTVYAALSQKQGYPILAVLRSLRIDRYLLYPQALVSGEYKPCRVTFPQKGRRLVSKVPQQLGWETLSNPRVQAHYNLFLPDAVKNVLDSHLRL